MSMAVLILVASQLLYTTGDLMGRVYMARYGFCAAAFLSWWFAVYFILRTIAMFGQLYVFTTMPLGKTMALFGAVSILLSNALGLLLLREVLSPTTYVGVTIAIVAFVILAFR
jgi:multidrug transporter EmrE-like cation transporter